MKVGRIILVTIMVAGLAGGAALLVTWIPQHWAELTQPATPRSVDRLGGHKVQPPASQPAVRKVGYDRPATAPTLADELVADTWTAVQRPIGRAQALRISLVDDLHKSDFYWRWQAQMAMDADRPAAAQRFLLRAYQLAPKSVGTRIGLGLVEQRQGHLPEAEQWLAKAVKLDPWNVEALYDLGVIQQRQDHLHDAENSYLKVVATQPDHLKARFNLAVISDVFGRLLEGRGRWEKVVALKPDLPEGRKGLGQTYYLLYMYDEAIAQFEAVRQQDPKNADIWDRLGLAYQMKKDYDEALLHLAEAHRLAPNNVTILNRLADLHIVLHQQAPHETEHLKEAIRFWKLSQALNSDQPVINNMLKYFKYRDPSPTSQGS